MHRLVNVLVAGTALVGSACAAVENQRGYVPDADALQGIVAGTDTKATVAQKLGNPSSSATFNSDTWYYISSHDVQTAFFATRSTERNVVAVKFAQNGQVAAVKRYALEDGRVVDYQTRETPTRGRELTLLQQIFNAVPGNVGTAQQPQEQNPGGDQPPP